MPKATKKPAFYAVAKGHVPGIYSAWDECQKQITGFAGNKHKKFSTVTEANAFLSQHSVRISDNAPGSSGPSAASSSTRSQPLLQQQHGSKPYSRPPVTPKPNGPASGSKPSRWAALSTEVIEDESGWDVVYSDGACKGNGKPRSVAGIGVWWGSDDVRNIAERCPGGQTNNRAELTAIVRVLETTPHTKRPLLIKTDSKYSISCFREWMPKWLKSGFVASNGKPVKNAPLIRYLSALLDQRAREGQKARSTLVPSSLGFPRPHFKSDQVHLQYVKGHAGEEGNEGADYLANLGATMGELPENDWDALIETLGGSCKNLFENPPEPAPGPVPTPTQEELEAYAQGLVDDDELWAEVM
ncbi:hypothetical protein GSI_09870 [Ganoderma sinense ZZ0214-1]|uniref:Ribonuclease H n=1 Tax=Ganoderma sinense ZZ0214-1 TaxID=1077348 RepID=A0A2G8S2L7_9APHY|nr:hypothetical protein GSI_09870 [Ganoderma sinense ZZ0214-1]